MEVPCEGVLACLAACGERTAATDALRTLRRGGPACVHLGTAARGAGRASRRARGRARRDRNTCRRRWWHGAARFATRARAYTKLMCTARRLVMLGAATRRRHIHAGARCSCIWRRTVGACCATAEEQPTPLVSSHCRAATAPGGRARRTSERRWRWWRDTNAATADEVRLPRGSALLALWAEAWHGRPGEQAAREEPSDPHFRAELPSTQAPDADAEEAPPAKVCEANVRSRLQTLTASPHFRGRHRQNRLVSLQRRCSLPLARHGARCKPSERHETLSQSSTAPQAAKSVHVIRAHRPQPLWASLT